MYGVGGVVGALVGGAITERYGPYYTFIIMGLVGLGISSLDMRIDSQTEVTNNNIRTMEFI